MKIREIAEVLHGSIICREDLADREVISACGSDMMSDVLAYTKDQAVLITGLCNPQVVRTAEMIDVLCIVFVRNKMPDQETIDLAAAKDIVMVCTPHRMFSACGILYKEGLISGN